MRAPKNIILLVLDEYQSDVFYELVTENSSLKKKFRGFTYYPDTISGFPQTQLSIPSILTGEYYDNSVTFNNYLKKSYLGNSLPKVLKDKGYQVDLFPKFTDKTILIHKNIASNISNKVNKEYFINNITNSIDLIDYSLFRFSPHLLKKVIYNRIEWKLLLKKPFNRYLGHTSWHYTDNMFINDLTEDITTKVKTPVFKFYHLKGAHSPYTYDKNGNLNKNRDTRESYKGHMHNNLSLVTKILDILEENNLYNNSLIIIIGDHGAGRTKDNFIRLDNLGYDLKKENGLIPVWIKSRAITVALIKDFNSNQEFEVSTKQLSLSDIPKLIFHNPKINIKNTDKIRKANHLSLNHNTRSYMYYDHSDRELNYMPPLYEYIIDGHSWLDSSWSGPQSIYTLKGKYSIIKNLDFGIHGTYKNYKAKGMKYDIEDASIFDNNSLSISISNLPHNEDLIFYIKLYLENIHKTKLKIYNHDKLIWHKTIKNTVRHPPLISDLRITPNNKDIKLSFEVNENLHDKKIGLKYIKIFKAIKKQ